MKSNLPMYSAFLLLTALGAQAGPVLIRVTPGDSLLSTPTGPSPRLANLLNFDGLTPFSTFSPSTFLSEGVSSISSPDGLLVEPFSTQSAPNELFDDSSDGSANITIDLTGGTNAIGIGIADSDGEVVPSLTITLQALAQNGTALGSAFVINLANTENLINTGNGYYVLADTTNDIFGLQITQSVGNANFSGLAIDDLATAPEPSSFLLLAAGVAIFASFKLLKRA